PSLKLHEDPQGVRAHSLNSRACFIPAPGGGFVPAKRNGFCGADHRWSTVSGCLRAGYFFRERATCDECSGQSPTRVCGAPLCAAPRPEKWRPYFFVTVSE